MLYDTVREELIPKVANVSKRLNFNLTENKMLASKMSEPVQNTTPPQKYSGEPKTVTTEIVNKSTSPTLVEFHSKNAAVPEWRLQLQNVIRQRQERGATTGRTETQPVAPRATLVTSGAIALEIETIEPPRTTRHKNPTLSSALLRIENSRRQFFEANPTATTAVAEPATPAKANKNYPFHIAPKTNETVSKPAEINSPLVNTFAKPKLAASFKDESEKLDTNKLPALPKTTLMATSFETRPAEDDKVFEASPEKPYQSKIEFVETAAAVIKSSAETESSEVQEIEDFDDCAPFAMRFNAGLFDLIIGSFVSLLLLAPFMLFGGNWLSIAGAFAFVATCAIVMFVYMTTAVGFYGRTFGMRLFGLEIVDVESADFPNFHQAAVSSAVYLLSLALGGIGFLTLPFNEDHRAVHDLVSGTIIIREE